MFVRRVPQSSCSRERRRTELSASKSEGSPTTSRLAHPVIQDRRPLAAYVLALLEIALCLTRSRQSSHHPAFNQSQRRACSRGRWPHRTKSLVPNGSHHGVSPSVQPPPSQLNSTPLPAPCRPPDAADSHLKVLHDGRECGPVLGTLWVRTRMQWGRVGLVYVDACRPLNTPKQ